MKSLVLGLALALAACSKTGSDNTFVTLKDEACACKDAICGEAIAKKLDDEMTKFDKELENNPKDPNAGPALAAMYEAQQCLQKLH
jgi:hypothetical protein